MKALAPSSERPGAWSIMLALCAIAVAVAIRRLLVLANPVPSSTSPAESSALVTMTSQSTLETSHADFARAFEALLERMPVE